ncbi:hypothetical protein B0T14DRAFT_567589 [Immersiella caudata]|uniref:F-box domain-containing protein n=1 Tax=Immersiella caudata TaxID=314043 RepID=A0AA39WSN6_9PEZI|nr:hypothetical protein B0T14DRAFT_567589 [Immersiella caudata]
MRTLLSLPVEILEAILEAVSSLVSSSDLSFQDLVALSKTCKLLHSLSLHHIYNDISPYHHWLLARTLITRPDIAQFVKQLSLECSWSESEEVDFPPEVDDYWERKAEGHSYEKPGDPDGMTDFWTLEPLFIAAPNIEEVVLQRFSLIRKTKAELRQLKRIEFVWSCIDAKELGRLLKLCPNLEELIFASSGGSVFLDAEPFTLAEAKEEILTNAPTLKRFRLDLRSDEEPGENEFQAAREEFAERGIRFELVGH